MTIIGDDQYQHVSLAGPVVETWDDPDLKIMDRLSMRYMGEPWQERKPCVSALIEIERWRPDAGATANQLGVRQATSA